MNNPVTYQSFKVVSLFSCQSTVFRLPSKESLSFERQLVYNIKFIVACQELFFISFGGNTEPTALSMSMKPPVFGASKEYINKTPFSCQGHFYNMFTLLFDHKMWDFRHEKRNSKKQLSPLI